MKIRHNSHKREYRNPFGAVSIGSELYISVDISPTPLDLKLHLIYDGKRELDLNSSSNFVLDDMSRYEWKLDIEEVGLIWYYFSFTYDRNNWLYYGNAEDNLGGEGRVYHHIPPSYQITCYKEASLPSWYRGGVIYQIFPDRFNRGNGGNIKLENYTREESRTGSRRIFHIDWNDRPFYPKNEKGHVTHWGFFGGTLDGIREKLSYLKSLGVSTIYLNPIFKGASNHKYDTTDYMELDEGFGDKQSFIKLAKEAESLGIYLMLDGVFSHTGADSIYFNLYGNHDSIGAVQSKESAYYSWYRFSDYPNKYECWWGVEDLPNLNEDNESYQQYLFGENGVILHWMELGAKAWRLDVADELPDSFIKRLTKTVKSKDKDGLVLGEVWEDASNKVSYSERREYLLGEELDCTMNYPFRLSMLEFINGSISSNKLARITMSLKENYPKTAFLGAMNMLSTHDTERIITMLGKTRDVPNGEDLKLSEEEYNNAKRKLKFLKTLQFTSPGTPAIYYGDEAGVEGMRDPYNRATYPWDSQDKELLDHTKLLSRIRKLYPVLSFGDYYPVDLGERVYAFYRVGDSEKVLVIANRTGENQIVKAEIETKFKYAIDLLSQRKYNICDGKNCIEIEVSAMNVAVIYMREASNKPITKLSGSGVLCYLSSLITVESSLESSAKAFIDSLKRAGQSYWQILPLNPVDKFGSPYSTESVFAGNYNLLTKEDISSVENDGFLEFCQNESYWLDKYALYKTFQHYNNNLAWQEWTNNNYNHNFDDEIDYVKKEQYIFWTIWRRIKEYANQNGIKIIGDLPVYVSADSADVWANKLEFEIDEAGYPLKSAGVPPDYFSEEGQSWGNPLYNWEAMRENNYSWWKNRIKHSLVNYDFVRLDHFRSFSAYYTILKNNTAKDGYWEKGDGKKFFDELFNEYGSLPIIAEDLGEIDAGVHELLDYTKFYGMDVYQFLNENASSNNKDNRRVLYSGTHDNQTLLSWTADHFSDLNESEKAIEILEEIFASHYDLVILPIQDLLLLDDTARINTPGTTENNWKWKLDPKLFDEEAEKRLYDLTKKYNRLKQEQQDGEFSFK